MHTPGTKKTAVHVEEEGRGGGGKQKKKKNWKKFRSGSPSPIIETWTVFFRPLITLCVERSGLHSDDGGVVDSYAGISSVHIICM